MNARRTLRTVGTALLLTGALGAAGGTSTVASERGGLRLELALNTRQLVEGQPLLTLVCLRNQSGSTVDDVAPLRLETGSLRLEIVRGTDAKVIQRKFMETRTTMFPTGGITLEPGDVSCNALDPLAVFGELADSLDPLSRLARIRILARGTYRMRAVLDLHTSFTLGKGHPQETLVSDWQEFTVVAAGPAHKRDLERLRDYAGVSEMPVGRIPRLSPEIRRRVGPHVPEFAGTTVGGLAYVASERGTNLPDEGLLAALRDSGNTEPMRAWILFDQVRTATASDAERLAWVKSALRRESWTTMERDVLRSWQLHFEQRKGYMSRDRQNPPR